MSEKKNRTAGDDIEDYVAGQAGAPIDSIAGQQGYQEYLGGGGGHGGSRGGPSSGMTVLAVIVLALIGYFVVSEAIKDARIQARLESDRKIKLEDQRIEVIHYRFADRSGVPDEDEPKFIELYYEMRNSGIKTLVCKYGNSTGYYFHDTLPDAYYKMLPIISRDYHSLLSIAGAASECPKTLGDHMDQYASYRKWSLQQINP